MVRLEEMQAWEQLVGKIVSIPVWFDWKSIASWVDFIVFEVSIPVWFDWKRFDRFAIGFLIMVSIPVWFDWKSSKSHVMIDIETSFNSSMVRLEVTIANDLLASAKSFNSTLVRLEVILIH